MLDIQVALFCVNIGECRVVSDIWYVSCEGLLILLCDLLLIVVFVFAFNPRVWCRWCHDCILLT